jgi:hypothetical protein
LIGRSLRSGPNSRFWKRFGNVMLALDPYEHLMPGTRRRRRYPRRSPIRPAKSRCSRRWLSTRATRSGFTASGR